MNKYISILIILFAALSTNNIYAQVTVGDTNEPEAYSALQLEGTTGGLRLPQLDATKRNALNTDLTNESSISGGVTIFNSTSTTNKIEFWDGAKWVAFLSGQLSPKNGLDWLDVDKTEIGLGGSLTEATTINLVNNKLSFITDATHPFSVNNSLFAITSNKINITASKFSFATSVFSVANNVSVNTGTSGKFVVQPTNNKSILTVTNNVINSVNRKNVIVEGPNTKDNLAYIDGNQAQDHVLISRADGTAYWGPLRPEPEILSGIIKGAGTKIGPGGTIVDITASNGRIKLTPGKWMVFGKFTAKATSTGMFIWIYLRKTLSNNTLETISVIGKDVDPVDSISFPELAYLMDVSEDTEISIGAESSNSGVELIETYGPPQFFAILIDKLMN